MACPGMRGSPRSIQRRSSARAWSSGRQRWWIRAQKGGPPQQPESPDTRRPCLRTSSSWIAGLREASATERTVRQRSVRSGAAQTCASNMCAHKRRDNRPRPRPRCLWRVSGGRSLANKVLVMKGGSDGLLGPASQGAAGVIRRGLRAAGKHPDRRYRETHSGAGRRVRRPLRVMCSDQAQMTIETARG